MYNSREEEIIGQQPDPVNTGTRVLKGVSPSTQEAFTADRFHEDEAVIGRDGESAHNAPINCTPPLVPVEVGGVWACQYVPPIRHHDQRMTTSPAEWSTNATPSDFYQRKFIMFLRFALWLVKLIILIKFGRRSLMIRFWQRLMLGKQSIKP